MDKKITSIAVLALGMLTVASLTNASPSLFSADGSSLTGLYETEYDPLNVTSQDGLLESYESKESFYYTSTFAYFYQQGLTYSASLNSDAAYVSDGSSSLLLKYTLTSYLDPAIYPSIYLSIPNDLADFDGPVKLSFDYCNLSSVDLGYYLQALGTFSKGPYTYKYSADNADSKGELLSLAKGTSLSHAELTLNVDFGTYNDGSTEGGAKIPRNVKYLRILLPQVGSGEISLYLDNLRITK